MESISFHLSLIQNNIIVRCVSVKRPEVLAEGGKHISVCFELEFANNNSAVTQKAGFSLLVQSLQKVLTVMGTLHFDNEMRPLRPDLGKQNKTKQSIYIQDLTLFPTLPE